MDKSFFVRFCCLVILFFIEVEYYLVYHYPTKISGLNLFGIKAKDSSLVEITKCEVKSSERKWRRGSGGYWATEYCEYIIQNHDNGVIKFIRDFRPLINQHGNIYDPRPCELVGALLDCYYPTEYPDDPKLLQLGDPSELIVEDVELHFKWMFLIMSPICIFVFLFAIFYVLTQIEKIKFD